MASNRNEMREGIGARREQGLGGKGGETGRGENKQDTAAIEWSVCTDERPSDTNQLGTIKSLEGYKRVGEGRRPADRVGGP